MTIDLDAGDVKRIEDEKDAGLSPVEGAASPETAGETAAARSVESEQESAAATDPAGAEEKDAAPRAALEEGAEASGEGDMAPNTAERPRDEPPLFSRPPERRASGAGLGLALGAGIAGGVIVLLVAGGLQWAGVIPGLGTKGAKQQIAALESGLASVKQDVASIRSAPGASDITALKNEIAAANQKIGAEQSALDQMKAQLTKSGEASAATQKLAAQLKDVEGRLAKVANVASTNASGQSAIAGVTGQVNSQAQALQTANQALSAQSQRISKLEQETADLSKKVAAQAGQPKIAMAIAASALKSAVDRGTPFASELDTYASIAPKSPEIDALRQFAANGVPTREAIIAGIGPAADAMVAAAEPADKDKGVWSDLIDSARSLVKVRPVGEVRGSGVGATVARMEVEIKAGDFAKSVQEYETLPPDVKAAGASFMNKVKTYLQAESLVQKALSSALKKG